MAVGRVEQVISLKGENNTRKAVEEAKAGLLGLGTASKDIAEKSGDLERGFRGVSDIVGKVGGVDLSGLTEQLGGVEALIKGFAGAFSPVGIAIAAVGAGVTYWYQKQQEAQKAILDAKKKDIDLGTADLEKSAARYNVEASIFGIEKDKTGLKEIQNTLQDLFNKQKETEKKLAEERQNQDIIAIEAQEFLLNKQKELIQVERDRARAIISAEKERQDLEKERIDKSKRKELDLDRQILVNEFVAFSQRTQKARKELEYKNTVERIKALQVQIVALNNEDVRLGGTKVDIAEKLKTLQGESFGLQRKLIEDDRARAEKGKQYAADQRSALVALAQAQADAAENASADEQEVFELKIKAIRDAEAAEIKAARISDGTQIAKAAKIETIQLGARAKEDKLRDEIIARQAERDKQSIEGDKRVVDAKLAAQDVLTKAQIAAATNPATKYDLVLADLKIQAERKLAEVRANGQLDSEARAEREKAIAIETALAVTSAEREKKDAIKKTADELQATRQKTIDAAADTVSTAASMVASFQGKGGLGTALVETAKQVKSVSSGWQDNKNQAGALIGAVGNVATAFVDGEREKAGILAIMETAQAIASAAIGDVPGAIAHGSAAALYGSVAGGLISGGGAAAAPSAGGGGFAAGGAGAGGGAATGGPATTVINFNAPLGTAYEIGKSVVKAQKAAGSSGWSPNMAMGV
jgi:hypothetical protein